MASSNKLTAPAAALPYKIQAERYNFFQLVELLYQLSHADLEQGLNTLPAQEPIRYLSNASLAFPISDISSLQTSKNHHFELEVSLFGLTGSQSPLPGYYIESTAWEYFQQNKKLGLFLDLFNHRLVTLLHRVWRKYRYYINFKNAGSDAFSQRMFALVGLGKSTIRDSLQINKSKMLAYAGLLANASRSPQILIGLISHCFELDDVSIDSWQFRRVAIDPKQQNRLGEQNALLNNNMILGSSIPDCSGKFLLRFDNLDLKRFLTFLPNGKEYKNLVTFVSFILRGQLACDLQLGLKQEQASGLHLGVENSAMLGWTTFLGAPPLKPNVTITIQE